MNTKICSKCNTEKSVSEFHSNPSRNTSAYCKKCFNGYCMDRWTQRKIDALEYKGNKCEDCTISYPEYPYVIFDFHHLDPTKKSFSWTKMRLVTQKVLNKELDKCALLCSNCHRIRHYKSSCQNSNLDSTD
jgi:hypothetical protein